MLITRRMIAHSVAQAGTFKETMARLNLQVDYADSPAFSNALARQAQDYRKLLAVLKKE